MIDPACMAWLLLHGFCMACAAAAGINFHRNLFPGRQREREREREAGGTDCHGGMVADRQTRQAARGRDPAADQPAAAAAAAADGMSSRPPDSSLWKGKERNKEGVLLV